MHVFLLNLHEEGPLLCSKRQEDIFMLAYLYNQEIVVLLGSIFKKK